MTGPISAGPTLAGQTGATRMFVYQIRLSPHTAVAHQFLLWRSLNATGKYCIRLLIDWGVQGLRVCFTNPYKNKLYLQTLSWKMYFCCRAERKFPSAARILGLQIEKLPHLAELFVARRNQRLRRFAAKRGKLALQHFFHKTCSSVVIGMRAAF